MAFFKEQTITFLSEITQADLTTIGSAVVRVVGTYCKLNQSFQEQLETDNTILQDLGVLYIFALDTFMYEDPGIMPWEGVLVCSAYLVLTDQAVSEDTAWHSVVDYPSRPEVYDERILETLKDSSVLINKARELNL